MEFLKNDKEINAYGHMDEKAFFEPYNAPFRQLWSQAMAKLSRMAAHLTPGQNQELQECVEQLCQAQSDYAGGRFVRGYHVGMAAAMVQYGIPGAAAQAQLIPGLEKLEDLAQELNNVKQAQREHPRDAMPLHTTPVLQAMAQRELETDPNLPPDLSGEYLQQRIMAIEDQLRTMLDDEGVQLLESLQDLILQKYDTASMDRFIWGYRLGASTILDLPPIR